MKKRISAGLLSVVLLFLCGCGKSVDTGLAEEIPQEAAEEIPQETEEEVLQETEEEIPQEAAEEASQEAAEETSQEVQENFEIVLSFAGDICFDDTCAVMQYYAGQQEQLDKCISPELIELMNGADLMWINNEFAYSLRGAPLDNKMYTFRADPKRAEMLKELGVDIVGLANNHVYDYGPEAMQDTLDTLKQAGISYVGAGKNLEEAASPVYFEVEGKTIAYVAASRAEKYKMTPQATEEDPGILRCYDTELFLDAIREARQNADYVIALVHWGTEYSTELEEVQLTTGKEYIDAGADAVIGAHTHCLQGIEYYQGKPIVYSLGNFWFNNKSLDTMLLQLRIYGEGENFDSELKIIPAKQENCQTEKLEGEEAEELFDYLEGLSFDVEIDEEGIVQEGR